VQVFNFDPDKPRVEYEQPPFSSTLIIGAGGSGKTSSLASIHKVLRLRKLPTKIAFFDFDDDGIEPFLRFAREGRETYHDKPGTVAPWIHDILAFRYPIKHRRLDPNKVGPSRDKSLAVDFMNDFNSLDEERMDARTNQWKPGQELGAIIFDPLTGLADLYEDFIWVNRNKEIGAPPRDKDKISSVPSAVEWTEFNLLGENIRNAYMTAKGFPCYFLATGHVDAREEEVRSPQKVEGRQSQGTLTTGRWRYVPLLTKSLAMRISKDFSTVLFATVDKEWRTQSSEIAHIEGVRSRGKDNLPPVLDKQDLSLVLDV
jgi:hypothetical protein